MPPKKKQKTKTKLFDTESLPSSFYNLSDRQKTILQWLYNLRHVPRPRIATEIDTQTEQNPYFSTDYLPLEQWWIYSQSKPTLLVSNEKLQMYRGQLIEAKARAEYFPTILPEWIANVHFMSVLNGTLMPAIDIFVDVTQRTVPPRAWNELKLEEKIDVNLVVIREMSIYATYILTEVIEQVKKNHISLTVLVTTHFICDPSCYTSTSLDLHTTTITFSYEHNQIIAAYEDLALSNDCAAEFNTQTLYMYNDKKQYILQHKNSLNGLVNLLLLYCHIETLLLYAY
jgi:nitrogen regulatory protein PII-like uncharacterized protein